MKIPLIRPYIPAKSREYLEEVLASGFLTEGPMTRRLEDAVAEYVGCRYVFAVPNCTVGLEIALRAAGIGPGDEVVVPDYTYPATADAVAIVGAVPVIVDIDRETMLMDIAAAEDAITEKTRAVMPVSEFGNPLDHDAWRELCERHGLRLIEDAACSLGSAFKGRRTGGLADVSVFSMHPRKFITSGEGGLVTTDDDGLADFINRYKHFGIVPGGGISFGTIGTNAKLSNILSAVALGQFEMIDEMLERRIALARRYTELLSGARGIRLPRTTRGGLHSYQTYSVFVQDRDRVMREMRESGIEAQIGTIALHREKAFGSNAGVRLHGSLSNADEVADTNLALPLYHEMTSAEQDAVVSKLLDLVRVDG